MDKLTYLPIIVNNTQEIIEENNIAMFEKII